MPEKILILLLTITASNAAFAGEIYRCIGAHGEVSYTNISCPAKSEVQHVASYQPEAPSPPPSANEIAAAAAAASARDARIAAEQARVAAYQAQAYEQSQYQEAQSVQPVENYASGWVPPYVPSGMRERHHRDFHEPVRRHNDSRIGALKPSTPVRQVGLFTGRH